MRIEQQLRNIASDLLNLEINTILKPDCTGRKMPSPRLALHQIGRKYNLKLTTLGVPVKSSIVLGSYQSFKEINEQSREGIERLKQQITYGQDVSDEFQQNYWMLYRINSISQEIINVLDLNNVMEMDEGITTDNIYKYPEIKLTVDQLVKIRKAWELGIEEVAIQTIVQIDGDIITRVQPKYTIQEYSSLHEIHDLGIKTSVDFWKTLIGVLTTFVGKSVKDMF